MSMKKKTAQTNHLPQAPKPFFSKTEIVQLLVIPIDFTDHLARHLRLGQDLSFAACQSSRMSFGAALASSLLISLPWSSVTKDRTRLMRCGLK